MRNEAFSYLISTKSLQNTSGGVNISSMNFSMNVCEFCKIPTWGIISQYAILQ